jgi:hypothetical protein
MSNAVFRHDFFKNRVPLIMTVDTGISANSANNQFELPLYGSTTESNPVIYEGQQIHDLNNGNIITFSDGQGIKNFQIYGNLPPWSSSYGLDNAKVLKISELGTGFRITRNSMFTDFVNCEEITGNFPLREPYKGNMISCISGCNSLKKLHLNWSNFTLTQYRRFFQHGDSSNLEYLYLNYKEINDGSSPVFDDFFPSVTNFSERFELTGLKYDMAYGTINLQSHLSVGSIPTQSVDALYKQLDESGKTGRQLYIQSNQYTSLGAVHRQNLINKNFTINDGGITT